MILAILTGFCNRGGLSRTSGGDPDGKSNMPNGRQSFPHERGGSEDNGFVEIGNMVFPARAGVIPALQSATEACRRLSLTSGGDPQQLSLQQADKLSFPHERG